MEKRLALSLFSISVTLFNYFRLFQSEPWISLCHHCFYKLIWPPSTKRRFIWWNCDVGWKFVGEKHILRNLIWLNKYKHWQPYGRCELIVMHLDKNAPFRKPQNQLTCWFAHVFSGLIAKHSPIKNVKGSENLLCRNVIKCSWFHLMLYMLYKW